MGPGIIVPRLDLERGSLENARQVHLISATAGKHLRIKQMQSGKGAGSPNLLQVLLLLQLPFCHPPCWPLRQPSCVVAEDAQERLLLVSEDLLKEWALNLISAEAGESGHNIMLSVFASSSVHLLSLSPMDILKFI